MAVVAVVWAKTKNMTLLGKYVTNPLPSPTHWLTTGVVKYKDKLSQDDNTCRVISGVVGI